MHTVHLRVNDAATGKPTPACVRVLDAGGAYRAPFGRLAEFATGPGEDVGGNLLLGAERFAYIDGACEVRLPPGPVTVEVSKGPEYSPLRREVTLGPGQISLRLAVERWTDLRPEGWYAGDTRATELSPHAALVEGAAEGLAVVNLLARERPGQGGAPAVPNLLAFSGTRPALEGPECLVAVNTLNAHPLLGTVALLNSHRVVYPLRFGGPGGLDDWSVADWCDQCHRKSGLVVWPDLPRLTAERPQGEALAALLLGKVDAYEVSRFDDPEPEVLAHWYRLLNCGLRVPLAGGSGKDSNAVALGSVRTYARIPPGEAISYAAWVEAVRAGRTFVTNGPLLTLTVEGHGPGAVVEAPLAGRRLRVRAEAQGTAPFDRLEILADGEVLIEKEASGNRQSAVLEVEHAPAGGGWLAARCWGRERLPDGQCVYAHTSPVYVEAEGRPVRPSGEVIAPLLAVLDQTLGWVTREARCENEQEREHLAGVLGEARRELLRRQGG
ncbi:MAG TPA: CehA/McbA family metallohydrolase [Gemmataceae bacterium]|nr:CehA/McbA family metallohydrolase [Gemmataceae bacterium]